MTILPLRRDLERDLDRHQLRKKWDKQKKLLENNCDTPASTPSF